MNLLKALRRNKTKFHTKPEHNIQLAFEYGGIDYFHFPDVFNIPCMRAMSAIQFYEEMRMRMTKDFLLQDLSAHSKLNESIRMHTSGKTGAIDLEAAHKLLRDSDTLIQQKKERLEWIAEPETIYNLASIVYFDSTEDPYKYDRQHGLEKIKIWKESKNEMLGFFLQQPMSNYMPYFKELNHDFRDYLKVVEDLEKEHLANISAILSKKN